MVAHYGCEFPVTAESQMRECRGDAERPVSADWYSGSTPQSRNGSPADVPEPQLARNVLDSEERACNLRRISNIYALLSASLAYTLIRPGDAR